MPALTLILVDPNRALCEAFRERFAGLPSVEIVNGRFETLPAFDCMVSAANSFGLMDGGVDAAIINFFGPDLMARVQARILHDFLGEQPVGTSMLVETGHAKHPYIAHTPTMRVPMSIARIDWQWEPCCALSIIIINCTNALSAAWPVRAWGTATGQVPAHEAARQMALAYHHYLNPPNYLNWRIANERQHRIVYGGDMGLELPPDLRL